MCLFGPFKIAGLFDVIANEGELFWGLTKGDVPSIVSPVAFDGASVARLQPWVRCHGLINPSCLPIH